MSQQAGESGVTMVFVPTDDNGNPFPMGDATSAELVYAYPGGVLGTIVSLTIPNTPLTLPNGTVVAAGNYATYVTTAEDFNLPGNYTADIEIGFTGGALRKSAAFTICIGATALTTDLIATSGSIVRTGPTGAAGASGAAGHGATTTTAAATVPAVGATVTLALADSFAFPVETPCIASDGAHAFIGTVTALAQDGVVITCARILDGAAGATLASGATLTFTGASLVGALLDVDPSTLAPGRVITATPSNGYPYSWVAP